MDEQKLLETVDSEVGRDNDDGISEHELHTIPEISAGASHRPRVLCVPERWSRQYTLGLLLVTTAFLYTDQNLMAPNLSAIARDFGLNDAESMLMSHQLP